MKKIKFKKILSLVLCLLIIAPVIFSYNIISANSVNHSNIESFKILDVNSETGVTSSDILAAGNHIVKRASFHIENEAKPIELKLTDILPVGARTDNFTTNVTWKAVLINGNAGIIVDEQNPYGVILTGLTEMNLGGGVDKLNDTIKISAGSAGDIVLEVWVTLHSMESLSMNLNDDYGMNRDNFLIRTIRITVANDTEHETLGVDFIRDASTTPLQLDKLRDEPLALNPAGQNLQARITISGVFVYDFNNPALAPSYKNAISAFQWYVYVEGESVEVVNSSGQDITSSGTNVFTNTQRIMTVRPKEIKDADGRVTGKHAGESTVIIAVRQTANDEWRYFYLYFDVTSEMNFDTKSPMLIAPGTPATDERPGTPNRGSIKTEIEQGYEYYFDSNSGVGIRLAEPKEYNYVEIPIENLEVTMQDGITRKLWEMSPDKIRFNVTVPLVRYTGEGAAKYEMHPRWIREGNDAGVWKNSEAANRIVGDFSGEINNLIGRYNRNNGHTLLIPYEFLVFPISGAGKDTATVSININAEFIDIDIDGNVTVTARTLPVSKTVTVRKITGGANNDEFISFEFYAMHDAKDFKEAGIFRDTIATPETAVIATVNIDVDKDGNYKIGDRTAQLEDSIIILNKFTAQVYDTESSELKKTVSDYKITAIRTSDPRAVTVPEVPEDGLPMNAGSTIELKLTGETGRTSTIIVIAERTTGTGNSTRTHTIQIRFNVKINNVGIFEDDMGKIISVNLKRDNKGRIYTADEKDYRSELGSESIPSSIYLKPWLEARAERTPSLASGASYLPARPAQDAQSVTINIDEVRVNSKSSTNNYTDVLTNYEARIRVQKGSGRININKKIEWQKEADDPENYKAVRDDEPDLNYYKLEPDNKGRADFEIEAVSGGEVIISVKLIPVKTADKEKTLEYRNAATVYFRIIINALGGEFELIADTDQEIIRIERFIGSSGEIEAYSFNGEVEYMYALRAADGGSKQSSEKWFPVMGSTIDISELIPRSGSTVYRVAVRRAGDDIEPQEDGNYGEDTRRLIELKARRTVSSAERKNIIYDKNIGALVLSGAKSESEEVLYKVGLSQWASVTLSKDSGISALSQYHPLGSTVEIRFKDSELEKFDSASFKVKIPKAAKPPSLKADKKQTKLSGLTAKISWSADYTNPEGWTKCTKGVIAYNNLQEKFPGLNPDGNGYYNLYLKTDASGKNLDSAPVIFKIPAERYE